MLLNVFFDLDGTLTDPKKGITRCIQYALEKLGRPLSYESDLTRFIGPPLRSSFAKLLSSDDEDLIEKAVGYDFEGFDRTIDVHIHNLRRKLEQQPGHRQLIKTIYGAGYKLIAISKKT